MSPSEAPSGNTAPLSVPVYQILLSLCDCRLHGYAILQDIRERTHGDVRLAAGTLYAALARMKRDGWVTEVGGEADDAEDSRRRYYEITDLGAAVLREEAVRLRRAVEMAELKRVLAPGT